jgi:hypothetical protein
MALQEQTMKDIDSKHGFDFSPSTANMRAYQATLLELTQANMQFAFEFAAKLGTIRSPAEIFSVIVEFTSKRIALFQKFSIGMAELGKGVKSRRLRGEKPKTKAAALIWTNSL